MISVGGVESEFYPASFVVVVVIGGGKGEGKREEKEKAEKRGEKTTDFTSPPPILINRVRKAYQTKADSKAERLPGGREKRKGGKIETQEAEVSRSIVRSC